MVCRVKECLLEEHSNSHGKKDDSPQIGPYVEKH